MSNNLIEIPKKDFTQELPIGFNRISNSFNVFSNNYWNGYQRNWSKSNLPFKKLFFRVSSNNGNEALNGIIQRNLYHVRDYFKVF